MKTTTELGGYLAQYVQPQTKRGEEEEEDETNGVNSTQTAQRVCPKTKARNHNHQTTTGPRHSSLCCLPRGVLRFPKPKQGLLLAYW